MAATAEQLTQGTTTCLQCVLVPFFQSLQQHSQHSVQVMQESLPEQITHSAQKMLAVPGARGGVSGESLTWKERSRSYSFSGESRTYRELNTKMIAFLRLNVGPNADK